MKTTNREREILKGALEQWESRIPSFPTQDVITDVLGVLPQLVEVANDEDIASGGPMTGYKLRAIADWLDIYDKMAEDMSSIAASLGMPSDDVDRASESVRGKSVQQDLRRWAAELDGSQ